VTDWGKLHDDDLLHSVDAIAIKKFGHGILPDPQIVKIAVRLWIDTFRAIDRDPDGMDVATRAAKIIIDLRRELEELKGSKRAGD